MKNKANGNVKAWVRKAEQDWISVECLVKLKKKHVWEVVCFHAQQCAEKYLKALLVKNKIHFPKTHDLPELLGLALARDASLAALKSFLVVLDRYSVEVRYPGAEASKEEALECYGFVRKVRAELRKRLGERVS